jgi:hypothetical protein
VVNPKETVAQRNMRTFPSNTFSGSSAGTPALLHWKMGLKLNYPDWNYKGATIAQTPTAERKIPLGRVCNKLKILG